MNLYRFFFFLLSLILLITIFFSSFRLSLDNQVQANSDFYAEINSYRLSRGLQQVYPNSQLVSAAKQKVEEMFQTMRFEHTNPMQKYPQNNGYSFRSLGELLASDFWTDTDVFEGWKGSQGHNALMIKSNFCEAGYYLESRVINGSEISFAALFLGEPKTGCENISAPILNTSKSSEVVSSVSTIVSTTSTSQNISLNSTHSAISIGSISSQQETTLSNSVSTTSTSNASNLSVSSASNTTISAVSLSSTSQNVSVTSNIITSESSSSSILITNISSSSNSSVSSTVQQTQVQYEVISDSSVSSSNSSVALSVNSSEITSISSSNSKISETNESKDEYIIVEQIPIESVNSQTDQKRIETTSSISKVENSSNSSKKIMSTSSDFFLPDNKKKTEVYYVNYGVINNNPIPFLGNSNLNYVEYKAMGFDKNDLLIVFGLFILVIVTTYLTYFYWKKRIVQYL
jgi:hypothetical protein